MSEIRIVNNYPHSLEKVWRALTDPQLIPLWTATGRGGRPEGFSTEVGTRFQFVGRPVPGWDGIVKCEVLEANEPSLLRYSWDSGGTTQVTYRIAPHGTGTRFTYEHTGFTGIGGFLLANVVLGPVRKKMLSQSLPAVLDEMDDDGQLRSTSMLKRDLGLPASSIAP
jgi:uncharacterized protein YndB with AHSA1/START domain